MHLFNSVALATAVLVMLVCNATADITSVTHTIEISTTGDATHTMVIAADAESYTRFKINNTTAPTFLYNRGLGMGWQDLEKVQSTFDDSTSSFTVEFLEYGFTRPIRGDKWSTSSTNHLSIAEHMIEAARTDTTLSLTSTLNDSRGIFLLKIVAPRGAHYLNYVPASRLVTYTLPVVDGTSSDVKAEMDFQTKEELMSCAAKAYAITTFQHMWVARNLFRNTGTRVLRNYRTRWRLADYSQWSAWEHSETVVPGQTVVDAFYPIIDLTKVATLTGPVTAALETEYEYRRPDGETVRDSDSHRITILARNQLVFSSLPQDKIAGFHDAYANGPFGLASFVTHNDPVVQQLAGWINATGGGLAAGSNNKDAIRFMALLYTYIANSHIAYQTPPGGISGGKMYQHIKYARDVLHNRAGTCIDLAILYASVAEAVGLKPVMFLVPGHCFPAVLLPDDGALLPIEATMTGHADFEVAVHKAMEEVRQARNSGLLYEVNIRDLQNSGVDALELTAVPVDYLERLGYKPRESGDQPRESGDQPRETSYTPTGRLIPALQIANPLPTMLRYRLLTSGTWKPYELPAGKVMHHWYTPGPDEPVPPVLIQFDADMGAGVDIVTRTLQWKMVQHPEQDGVKYYFAIRDGVLGLFPGDPPQSGDQPRESGDQPRETSYTPTGRLIPALQIANPLPTMLRYRLLTSGTWKPYELPAGKVMRHWYTPGPDEPVPPVLIQFDADMGAGVDIVTRTLQWKMVQHPEQDGVKYHFNVAGSNRLDIYQGIAPGQQ